MWFGNNNCRVSTSYEKGRCRGGDLSEVVIDHAKERYGHIENLSFFCNDAVALSEDEGNSRIDLITLFELLEHIEDWEKMLCGLLDKYMPIYVIISSPVGRMRDYEKHVGHFRNYKRGQIEQFMERCGYITVDCYYAGFPFWSPICRDLINVFRKNAVNVQKSGKKGISIFEKTITKILYFLFRYCSCLRKGDQFVGMFKREHLMEKDVL